MKKRLQITALVVFVAATAAALIADQAPTPQPQAQTPTFKLQVDYVEVDAVVTDRDGNLVKDLKKKIFRSSKTARRRRSACSRRLTFRSSEPIVR
jgi:hypothetical protein